MAQIDLVFSQPLNGPGSPVELVFGDDGGQQQVVELRAAGRITGLRGSVAVRTVVLASARGTITGLRGTVPVKSNINVARPLAARTPTTYQEAVSAKAPARSVYEQAGRAGGAVRERGGQAVSARASTQQHWQESLRMRAALQSRMQDGQRRGRGTAQAWQESIRLRAAASTRMQDAQRRGRGTAQAWQEAIRLRGRAGLAFGAAFARGAAVASSLTDGLSMRQPWRARYEEAMRPGPGRTSAVVPPVEPPCYVPGLPAHLVFCDPWSASADLLFICCKGGPGPEPGETVVVPVKEVYLTINSAILIRLDSGRIIPATSLNMSLDVDSWTWQFSASIPGQALADVQPNSVGDPVVVQATVNGTPFNFTLERISRDRTFGSSQLRVSGRGLGAELDAPYAPEMSFSNEFPRTARQLVEDILTLNGVPIGWAVAAWNLTDWLVPAGVFNHSGSYISAVNAVVGAAGAYVQPHNTDRSLLMHLRYPAPAWEWDSVTPNFELPAAVTSQESFEWTEKPRYNRAFVIGQEHGVHGRYTRSGTAGDLPAPTVVDPLITHVDAVRQRGRAILSDTGRIATVALRLPVLAETGIIKPGNFVRYVEGGNTHIGLSRGVSVDVSMPTIYQTLTLETHVEPV